MTGGSYSNAKPTWSVDKSNACTLGVLHSYNLPRGLRIRIRATCHLLFPCLLFQFEFPTLLAKREIIANAVCYVICLVTLSFCFLFAVLRWLLSRLNVYFPRSMGFNFCKVSIWLRDGKENDEGVLAKEVLGR